MKFRALVKDLASELLGGYASGFFAAGFITYSLDYVNQILVILMLTVGYVFRASQVSDQNYMAFLAGYFMAAVGGLG